MRRRIFIVGALLALTAVLAFAQPGTDPWWRPLNSMGQSLGVGYGTVLPTLANSGTPPGDGELFVLITQGGNPQVRMFNRSTGAWNGTAGTGTTNVVTKWNATGTGLDDSSITDDATDVIATAGSLIVGDSDGGTDSIDLDGENGLLAFEGATSDAADLHIQALDFAALTTLNIQSMAAYTSGAILELETIMTVMDAGDTVQYLLLDMNQPAAGHDGAADIIGIDLDLSADDAQATDIGIRFDADYDFELQYLGDTAIQFPNQGAIYWVDAGAQTRVWLRDPAVDNDPTRDHFELRPTLSIMDDALDVQRLIYLNTQNVNHTNGAVWGVDISMDTPDPQADETGLHFNGDWDFEIMFGNGGANVIVYNGDMEISDIGLATTFFIRDTAADNAPPTDLLELDPTLSIMDAGGDVQRMLYLDIDNVNHTNGNVYGIDLDLDAQDAQANEYGINFTDAWDRDIFGAATLNMEATTNYTVFYGAGSVYSVMNGALTNLTIGGADLIELTPDGTAANGRLTLTDVPAAAASGTLATISGTWSIMDGAGPDVGRGLFVDLTSADHTGGTLVGIDIDGWVADAQAEDIALRLPDFYAADGDIHLFLADNTANIIEAAGNVYLQVPLASNIFFQHTTGNVTIFDFDFIVPAGTSGEYLEIDVSSMQAMDNAGGDIVRALYLDLTSADHTGGTLHGLSIDNDTEDADAFESAIWLSDEWDGHITMQSFDAAPADNPPAGAIALFIDDNADYSGGGGNDCALVARDAAGAVDTIATLVLNGACP